MVYTCQVRFNSQSSFVSFCNNQEWKSLKIYNQVNDIQYLGKLGNAIPSRLDDWTKVLSDYDFSKSSLSNNICTFPNTIILDIAYSRAGIKANPQLYITSAKFSARNTTISYQSAVDIKFVVNYIDLDDRAFDKPLPTPSILPHLPSDITDPLIKG